MAEPLYRSGDDVTIEHAGLRYAFAIDDLTVRVREAARTLHLDRLPPSHLVELLVTGDDPDHVVPSERIDDVVYWLRKLVFRSAWHDVRIEAGLLDTSFDERSGAFRHQYGGHDLPPALAPPPASLTEEA